MLLPVNRLSSFVAVSAMVVGVGAGSVLGQPADRSAAFQGAIAAASGQAPGWPFFEAELQNDSGQWQFEVQVVSQDGNAMLEYEVDPTSFAIRRSRSKSLSSGKIAQIQAALALLPSATVTVSQAITIAATRTPDGTLMSHIELGVESSHLVYKFEFLGSLGTQRVIVDAASGAPSTGGGTTPPGMGDLTLDQAITAALVLYPGAKILETEFEASDARWEIRLVTAQGDVRKVRIAVSGAVLSDDHHSRGREDSADDRLRAVAMQSATITLAQAKAIAEASAAGATAIRAEWEFEHGVLVAKVTLQDAFGLRTVFVNATSGATVTPTPAPAPAPEAAPVLDVGAAAVVGAATNAGSAAISVEMELKGGRQFYKVKTLSRTTPLRLREVVVDGKTGIVWSNTLLPMANSYLPTAQRTVALLPSVARTFAEGRQIALATLADGVVRSIELEPEQNTFLAYNVDVVVGAKTFSLVIDSRTGAVRPK
jgi:uncharacterized membrane protein YkoI